MEYYNIVYYIIRINIVIRTTRVRLFFPPLHSKTVRENIITACVRVFSTYRFFLIFFYFYFFYLLTYILFYLIFDTRTAIMVARVFATARHLDFYVSKGATGIGHARSASVYLLSRQHWRARLHEVTRVSVRKRTRNRVYFLPFIVVITTPRGAVTPTPDLSAYNNIFAFPRSRAAVYKRVPARSYRFSLQSCVWRDNIVYGNLNKTCKVLLLLSY